MLKTGIPYSHHQLQIHRRYHTVPKNNSCPHPVTTRKTIHHHCPLLFSTTGRTGTSTKFLTETGTDYFSQPSPFRPIKGTLTSRITWSIPGLAPTGGETPQRHPLRLIHSWQRGKSKTIQQRRRSQTHSIT